MAEAKYWRAPEVKEIADKLIPLYHSHLQDFAVRMDYVFTDKTPKPTAKDAFGSCKKISGLNSFLAGNPDSDAFFVIVVPKEIWDVMPDDKKEPLVDNLLCYAQAEAKQQKDDGDGDSDMETDNPVKLSNNTPDVVEFSAMVRRHGCWREGISDFVESALKAQKR